MKKSLVILIFGLLWTGFGWSQDQAKTNSKQQFPLEASFIAHAVTMPFSGIILSPLHPGFTIGTEYAYSEGRFGRLFQLLHA